MSGGVTTADAQSRQRALDPLQSFLVIAPAGSGKTELLTQRVLRLLARVDQPEEILAITFTRKAAGEMRRRVLLQLRAAAVEGGDDDQLQAHQQQTMELARAVLERDRQLNWRLLDNPNRLGISTVDGLCSWLTRRLPLLSGLGAGGSISADVKDRLAEAAQRLLRELDEGDEGLAADMRCLLGWYDNEWDTVERLLVEMLWKREQWLPLLAPLQQQGDSTEGSIRQFLQGARRRLAQDLVQVVRDTLEQANVAEQVLALGRFAAANIDDASSPLAALQRFDSYPEEPDADFWAGIATLLLTGKSEWRLSVTKRQGFPPKSAEKEEFLNVLAALNPGDSSTLASLRNLPSEEFDPGQWQLIQALCRLLLRACAHLRLIFAERAETDYSEVSMAARQALGDDLSPAELALRLGCKIRHILVDEFQDSSQAQYRLLEQLTRGWEEENADNPQNPCTLFLVGDGMQSCYRFRDADVSLFLRAQQRGIAGIDLETLKLQSNFRSQAGLVDWLNHHFFRIFPPTMQPESGAVSYVSAEAVHPAAESPAVHCQMFGYLSTADNRSLARQQAEQSEAAWVVAMAKRAMDSHSAAGNGAEVAILVRSRKHLAAVIPALRNAGLRWHAEEMDPLGDRPIAQDLLSLTRALLDPWDRIAWLALLRTPWCGVSTAGLLQLLSGSGAPGRDDSLWPRLQALQQSELLSDGDQNAVQRLCSVLQAALEQRQRRSLRRWIEGAWYALGGPACIVEDSEHEDAEAVLSLLEALDDGQPLSARRLLDRVAELYAAPDSKAPPLKLMTIHRAKGLEFDTVIVPGLHRSSRSSDAPLLRWQLRDSDRARPADLLIGPRPRRGDSDKMYDFLGQLDRQQQRQEEKRLLYIACTRAIRKLYLCGCARLEEREQAKVAGCTVQVGGRRARLEEREQAKDESAETALSTRDEAAAAGGANTADELAAPSAGSLLGGAWAVLQHEFAVQSADTETPFAGGPAAVSAPAVCMRLSSDWQAPPLPRSHALPPVAAAGPLLAELPGTDDSNSAAGWERRHFGQLLHRALECIAATGPEVWDSQRIEAEKAVWRAQLRQAGIATGRQEYYVSQIALGVSNALSDRRGRWILQQQAEAGAELGLLLAESGGVRRVVMDRSFVADGVRWVVDYKGGSQREGEDVETFIRRQSALYNAQLQGYREAWLKFEPQREVRLALYFPLLPQFCELPATG